MVVFLDLNAFSLQSWAGKQENLCIVLGSEGQVMDPLCRLYASLPVHHHTANETTP